MSARTWHLVCYDVRDDRRLRQVARLLEGWGERLQYSVFRCRLTSREEARLHWELTRLVAKEDSWLIVPVCNVCVRRLMRRNGVTDWPEDPPTYAIV